ncbi:hypothetical protein L0665_08900 [Methanogenium marinum]|uniref:Uncharacterized protein n=1 Tax=Methanogenium marinum TaxID=348610 RepID=A0A9Q4KV27_9EURY|nr:hypothetical protein [Methanogenium marinum]MDE4908722.1 hypothetical protein [Methanogenium marinum]
MSTPLTGRLTGYGTGRLVVWSSGSNRHHTAGMAAKVMGGTSPHQWQGRRWRNGGSFAAAWRHFPPGLNLGIPTE